MCLCLCCGGGGTEEMRKYGHHFMPCLSFSTLTLSGTFGMTNWKQHRGHLQSWHVPKLPILGRNNAGGSMEVSCVKNSLLLLQLSRQVATLCQLMGQSSQESQQVTKSRRTAA